MTEHVPRTRYHKIPDEPHDGAISELASNSSDVPDEQVDPAAAPNESFLHSERREWFAVSDLDAFLTNCYHYFRRRGFLTSVYYDLSELFVLLFTILFTSALLIFVRWSAVLHATTPSEITALDSWDEDAFEHLDTFQLFVVFVTAVALLYFVWCVIMAVSRCRWAWDMRSFFRDELHIEERELQTIEWSVVVDRIEDLQRTSKKLCIVKKDLDAHDIALRIMRKENYLIALVGEEILDLHVPGTNYHIPFSRATAWNLNVAILNTMFDGKTGNVRTDSLSANHLRTRFMALGILNLFFLPVSAAIAIMTFIFEYTEEIRRNPSRLAQRDWTHTARWRFREYNELPHVYQRRMISSLDPAEKYVLSFPSFRTSILARTLIYPLSAFCAVIIIASLVNEPLLLQWFVGGQSLLWWLATFGLILAVLRKGVYDEDSHVFQPEKSMRAVVDTIHYCPRKWRFFANTYDVLDEFESLFKYRVLLLWDELVALVLLPIVLATTLSSRKSCTAIVEFIRNHTVSIDGVGSVCSFATFDFTRHGNPKYTPAVGVDSGRSVEKSRHGKMEKSFVNFQAQHPHWVPPESANVLASQLKAPTASTEEQSEQLLASFVQSRMRDSHHEGAVRPSNLNRVQRQRKSRIAGHGSVEMSTFSSGSGSAHHDGRGSIHSAPADSLLAGSATMASTMDASGVLTASERARREYAALDRLYLSTLASGANHGDEV